MKRENHSGLHPGLQEVTAGEEGLHRSPSKILIHMGMLKILAPGKSEQARAQTRGKLFEELMATVLRHHGYTIDKIANVNYAGMELDIEGKATVAGTPLYAECKCHDTEIDSTKLQAFIGKYTPLWLKDKRCVGLFVAIPGINSHAKGYYLTHFKEGKEMTVRLLEEDAVLAALFKTNEVLPPDVLSKKIDGQIGKAGDWVLLFTDRGFFWIQYVIPVGETLANSFAIFDHNGDIISDKSAVDHLVTLYTDLGGLRLVTQVSGQAPFGLPTGHEPEEIIEVRGSSSCFEYHFPASPEFFVGRNAALMEIDSFVEAVVKKKTSSRGILFQANSGWGKSSLVLATVQRLQEQGHFAVAIDSRSASSPQFILRVAERVLQMYLGKSIPISGFEGATKALLEVGQKLDDSGKIMLIFLDQFENLFLLPDALRQIRGLFLKLCDCQSNLALGFSWKTDIIGSTNEFPYQLRDSISGSCKCLGLETFSEAETNALLDKLEKELRARIRKDLRFMLSEFSQGYPWLLKKLCAHVKAQREAGASQSEIADGLLNVEELFKEDLQGLSPEEDDALRQIAKAAPVSVSELGEKFKPEVVSSLINRRLIVRIGSKYDIYWDIFRDYLNTGRIPVQENYILRIQPGTVIKVMKPLLQENGSLAIPVLRQKAGLSEKSFYNVIRHMKLLGLVSLDDGRVKPREDFSPRAPLDVQLRAWLRNKLQKNRLVFQIAEKLGLKENLNLGEVAEILRESNPYISATDKTWRTYARTFADWMDSADLAIFERNSGIILPYEPGTEVKDRVPRERRGGLTIPIVQYTPIETAAIRIVEALQENRTISWAGMKKSTVRKALASLEDLGFVVRKAKTIQVLPLCQQFATNPEQRPTLFADQALKLTSFAAFIGILNDNNHKGSPFSTLSQEITKRLNANWTRGTSETNAKIMLDWARHAKLAPGAFAINKKGPRKTSGAQAKFHFDGQT